MADRFDDEARELLKVVAADADVFVDHVAGPDGRLSHLELRAKQGAYDKLASALRDTHNAAERAGRIAELERLLTWGTSNITHPLREHIQKRLAELKKGT